MLCYRNERKCRPGRDCPVRDISIKLDYVSRCLNLSYPRKCYHYCQDVARYRDSDPEMVRIQQMIILHTFLIVRKDVQPNSEDCDKTGLVTEKIEAFH
jgi:hypothetical protein